MQTQTPKYQTRATVRENSNCGIQGSRRNNEANMRTGGENTEFGG